MATTPRTPQAGMLISVNRDVAIPLVNQVHDQVVAAIASGDLKPGDRLPTIRELARFLRVNRNTVGQAYRLLESDGHVRTRAGGGTVVGDGRATTPVRDHELRGLVTAALKEATERGFGAREFGQLAYYEGQRWDCLPRVRVLMTHGYGRELEVLCQAVTDQFPAVDPNAMLLDELAELVADGRLDELGETDFALVPVRQLERAAELLAGAPFPLLAVGIGPSLVTLVQVAEQATRGRTRVAVVCTEPAGAVYMADVLRSAGVVADQTRSAVVTDPGLRETVNWADLVLVSDASADVVTGLDGGKPVIPFTSFVNESSLATVRSYIEYVIQARCTRG